MKQSVKNQIKASVDEAWEEMIDDGFAKDIDVITEYRIRILKKLGIL